MRKLLFVASAAAALYAGCAHAVDLRDGVVDINVADDFTLPASFLRGTVEVDFFAPITKQSMDTTGQLDHFDSATKTYFYDIAVTTDIVRGAPRSVLVDLLGGALNTRLELSAPANDLGLQTTSVTGLETCTFGESVSAGSNCLQTVTTYNHELDFTGPTMASFVLTAADLQGINQTGKLSVGVGGLTLADHATLSLATPEPSTWALMMLGFGGVGAALRRRNAMALA